MLPEVEADVLEESLGEALDEGLLDDGEPDARGLDDGELDDEVPDDGDSDAVPFAPSPEACSLEPSSDSDAKIAAARAEGTTRFGSDGAGDHGIVSTVILSEGTRATREASEAMRGIEPSWSSTVRAEEVACRNGYRRSGRVSRLLLSARCMIAFMTCCW